VRAVVGVISLAAAACLAGCGSGTHASRPDSAASCAGPRLTLSVHSAPAGATVSANGKYFAADCYDTGQPGRPAALTGLRLSVVQDGKVWSVASQVAAAHRLYTFHVPVVLPKDLQPGRATVRVDGYGASATVHVRRARIVSPLCRAGAQRQQCRRR
jgi:hypothetical protein